MAMNFRRRRPPEDPEINLIPFIDVLLVILIFLMLTTTYSKVSELKINLPTANAQASKSRPAEVVVLVAANGRYMVNREPLAGRGVVLAPAGMLDSDLASGRLVVPYEYRLQLPQAYYLAWNPGALYRPWARELYQWLQATAQAQGLRSLGPRPLFNT